MASNKDIFNNIYKNNAWGYKSGQGSDPKYAKEWIDLVNSFIDEKNIKSILDLGCGDWRIGEQLNLDNVNYIGVDVSSIMIEEKAVFEKENIKFINDDIEIFEYPDVDLILIKDVLQHLSVNAVKKIIDKIVKSSRYALISNDFNKDNKFSKVINNSTANGGHMYMDLSVEPFNFNFKNIIDFKSDTQIKRVYLYEKEG